MAAKSFLVADPSPPGPPFFWGWVPLRGTHEKYGPNILEFSVFQKDIWVL